MIVLRILYQWRMLFFMGVVLHALPQTNYLDRAIMLGLVALEAWAQVEAHLLYLSMKGKTEPLLAPKSPLEEARKMQHHMPYCANFCKTECHFPGADCLNPERPENKA
jgi:hypothetical protein